MGLPFIAPIDDRQNIHRHAFDEPLGYPSRPPAPAAARLKQWLGGIALLLSCYFLMSERGLALLPFVFAGGWIWLSGTAEAHQARGEWRDW